MKTIKRYLAMQDSDIPKEKQTVRGIQHENAVEKLRERAERVRFMYESGCSLTTISQNTGFSSNTVKNYLSANFSPVNAHYGKQRGGKLEPFRAEVLQMRASPIVKFISESKARDTTEPRMLSVDSYRRNEESVGICR